MTNENRTTSLLTDRNLRPVVVRLACLLCCLPLLLLHTDEIWRFHHFRHLPLAVVGFLVLVWQSTVRERTAVFLSPWWDRILLALAAVCLCYAVAYWRPLWGALSAAFVGASVIVWLRQNGYLDRFVPLIVFLVFFLRFPWQLDLKLLYLLQTVSAAWASSLLDTLHVDHVLTGSILWRGGKNFFVHEACNGVPLLFTVLACSYWWQVFRRRTAIHSVLVMLSSVVWTLALNVIWMVLVIWLTAEFQFDLQQGTWHALTRIVLFAATLFLVLCVDLAAAHYPNRIQWVMWQSESQPLPEESASLLTADFFGVGILVAFVILSIGQVSRFVSSPLGFSASRKAALACFEEGDLPSSVDGWKLSSFETRQRTDSDMRGLREARWQYQRDDETVILQTRYPFFQWHDAVRCYQVVGDIVSGAELSDVSDPLPNTVSFNLNTGNGLPGHALATSVRAGGETRKPRLPGLARSVGQRIREFLRTETASPFDAFGQPAYEFQLIHVGASSREPEAQREMMEHLGSLRDTILDGRLKGVDSE